MALVNTPPIRPPQKWLDDPELNRPIQELYFFLFQMFKRTGGGVDTVEINNDQITTNVTNIDINENSWPYPSYSGDDFRLASVYSIQGENYTTYTNEIIKLSDDINITLNETPDDEELVYIKSTGKGFNILSTKKVDGQINRRYTRPYVGVWCSYSIDLDTWSIL